MENVPATTSSRQVIDPFDRDNPRSLINIVPESIVEAIKRVPEDLLELTPKQLETMTHGKQWNMLDRRIRTSFWMEYARAQDLGVAMTMTNVYSSLCNSNYFYKTIIQDKVRLAHILTPPTDYNIAVQECLTYGVDRLRDILELPLYDDEGQPLPKVAQVILQTVEMLDARVKGAVVQRVEQKNLNMHFSAPQSKPAPETVEDLDRRIQELERDSHGVKAKAESVITVDGKTFKTTLDDEDE